MITDILFHGSEPLLNSQLVEETVLYGEAVALRLGKRVSFSLQTNLTFVSDAFLEFARVHEIGISTSLDGGEKQHNANRPYRGGGGSYHDVCRNIKRVMEIQKGICVVCVVTKYNVSHLRDSILSFEEMGITDVQFLPAVLCPGAQEMRPFPRVLAEEYRTVFEMMIRRWEDGGSKIHIRNLSQYLSALFLRSGIDSCRLCTSTDYHPILAVDIDGGVYPCDFFWGDKGKAVGNVLDTPMSTMLAHTNNPRMCLIEQTHCAFCDLRHICGGGCLADRLFSDGTPYYCATHRDVFNYLIEQLPRLVKLGALKRIMERSFPENTASERHGNCDSGDTLLNSGNSGEFRGQLT